MLMYAVVFINLALIFYTIGVWSEKRHGQLKTWHVIIFWIGLIFDTLGTTYMSKIANDSFKLNFHGITGLSAILLMLFHVIWASWVLIKNDEIVKLKFHKLSLGVWVIWLIPFLSGALFGMAK
jgi:uncharacterized repeat protein (TIGR03987 family)